MKILLFLLTALTVQQPHYVDKTARFTRGEIRFIKNVTEIVGTDPINVYRLDGGDIQVVYADQFITLGKDGFIHELIVLEQGEWIDMGAEY